MKFIYTEPTLVAANVRSYYYYFSAKLATIIPQLSQASQNTRAINIGRYDKLDQHISDLAHGPNATEQLEKLALDLKMLYVHCVMLEQAKLTIRSMEGIERALEVINTMIEENTQMGEYREGDLLLSVWEWIHKQHNVADLLEQLSRSLEAVYNSGPNSTMGDAQQRVDAVLAVTCKVE